MGRPMLLLILSVVIAAFSQIILKLSANRSWDSLLREYLNIYVICAYVMLIVSSLFTVIAFRSVEMKNSPIIGALGYVFVLLLSRIILREKIRLSKIVGMIMIFCGIFIFYM